jgi:3-oxoadipate enol-lactonase
MFHRVDGGATAAPAQRHRDERRELGEMARPLAERFRWFARLPRPAAVAGRAPRDVLEHAAEVVDLLDRLAINRAHLVATSFGGAVAVLVAARWRSSAVAGLDRVGRCPTTPRGPGRWRACLDSLAGGDRADHDALEPAVYSPGYLAAHGAERALRRRLLAALPDAFFEGLAGLLDSISSVALGGELAAVRCPTLVVAAELDRFIPRSRCRALAEGIAGARFVLVEGAGHAVVVEQPQRMAVTVRFLEGVGS